jgi:hypothetical protein
MVRLKVAANVAAGILPAVEPGFPARRKQLPNAQAPSNLPWRTQTRARRLPRGRKRALYVRQACLTPRPLTAQFQADLFGGSALRFDSKPKTSPKHYEN